MGLAYVKTLHVCILTRLSLIFFQNSIILLVFQTHLRKNCRLSLPTLGPTTDSAHRSSWQHPGLWLSTCTLQEALVTRGDTTQTRTEHVDQTHQNRRKHATDTNPIPQVHPGLQHLRGTAEPGWSAGMPPDFHTTLTTTSTAGTTRGATKEEEHAALKAYAYNWSRGQSKHRLACLRLKNKTNPEHTMLQITFQQHLWWPVLQELNRWQDSNPIFPPSERWVTFPGGRGMPLWRVSPFHSLPFSSTNRPPALERPARRNDRQ